VAPSDPDSDTGIETTRDGSLLVVTINRPDRGNALGGEAAVALADAFDEASLGSGEVRAVLLRAEGKHFCTGADIGGGRRGSGGESARPINAHMVRGLASAHHRTISAAFHCRVPVVAAVHGAAIGFGFHLALACDMVVAGEGAYFEEPFTKRGFNVDSGGSWLLPSLVGLPRAKRLLYLAERLDAATALEWGLLAEVVPDDSLEATARRWADDLANRATQAIAATKRLVNNSAHTDLDGALHDESMAVELTIRSRDFKEGMTAFVEKRPPEFTGG
jgi:2-(1,2-epoxy-1,2-dihydrophenyl)acetyl-CoA isomerase